MSVGEPDKTHKHLLAFSHFLPKQLFMLAIGLTDLPFYTVPVDGVFETLFGDTDQNLCGIVVTMSFDGLIDGSEREGSDRLAVAVFKERLHQQIACHALPFPESRSRCCHRANLVSLPDNAEGLLSSMDISLTVPQCPVGDLPPWLP